MAGTEYVTDEAQLLSEIRDDTRAIREIMERWDNQAAALKEKFSDPNAMGDLMMGMMSGDLKALGL